MFHISVSTNVFEDGCNPVGGIRPDIDLDVKPLVLEEDFDTFETCLILPIMPTSGIDVRVLFEKSLLDECFDATRDGWA
jgi:hypothetical protein